VNSIILQQQPARINLPIFGDTHIVTCTLLLSCALVCLLCQNQQLGGSGTASWLHPGCTALQWG
jgi:hypothetical protein